MVDRCDRCAAQRFADDDPLKSVEIVNLDTGDVLDDLGMLCPACLEAVRDMFKLIPHDIDLDPPQ
jgi:hypothetical protein